MCLYKILNYPKKAVKPVTVYKILTADNRSPYRGYPYLLGMNIAQDDGSQNSYDETKIAAGYLHAYLNRQVAENVMVDMLKMGSGPLKIAEMYIPEGTMYWLGTASEVAAERLYWARK